MTGRLVPWTVTSAHDVERGDAWPDAAPAMMWSMSDHDSFEERLRAIADEISRSVQRISELDLDELSHRYGVDADRARDFADAASQWLNDHLSAGDPLFGHVRHADDDSAERPAQRGSGPEGPARGRADAAGPRTWSSSPGPSDRSAGCGTECAGFWTRDGTAWQQSAGRRRAGAVGRDRRSARPGLDHGRRHVDAGGPPCIGSVVPHRGGAGASAAYGRTAARLVAEGWADAKRSRTKMGRRQAIEHGPGTTSTRTRSGWCHSARTRTRAERPTRRPLGR